MSLADKVRSHYNNKTAEKRISQQRLSWMLGMRQITMLERADMTRKIMMHYLVSKMSDNDIEEQIRIGKEFICGYRPGIIPNEQMYDEAAKKTRFSERNKELVKQVLVGGTPLKGLKISAQERQIVDQGCITVCRMFASIETYRKNTAVSLHSKVYDAIEDKRLSFLVTSCVTGTAIKSIKSYLDPNDSKMTPPFTSSAYFLLAEKFMSADEFREIEAMLKYIEQSLNDLIDNWMFYAEGIKKKTYKIEKAIGAQILVENVHQLLVKQARECPDILALDDLKQNLVDFYRLSKDEYMFSVNDVLAVSLSASQEAIESGRGSLYGISSGIRLKTDQNVTAFYKQFSRWKERNNK